MQGSDSLDVTAPERTAGHVSLSWLAAPAAWSATAGRGSAPWCAAACAAFAGRHAASAPADCSASASASARRARARAAATGGCRPACPDGFGAAAAAEHLAVRAHRALDAFAGAVFGRRAGRAIRVVARRTGAAASCARSAGSRARRSGAAARHRSGRARRCGSAANGCSSARRAGILIFGMAGTAVFWAAGGGSRFAAFVVAACGCDGEAERYDL